MKSKTETEVTLSLLAKEYSDESAARAYFESLRWPNGPECPHCKSKEYYRLSPSPRAHNKKRQGLYKCKSCRQQYTVTVGTIMEDSHTPISKWLLAFFLICSSKKSVSAHQLHRMIGVTYKTAWFMAHRIRYGFREAAATGGPLKNIIECDTGYIGGKPSPEARKSGKWSTKTPVVVLLERGGRVRPKVVASVTHKNIVSHVRTYVPPRAVVNTDCAGVLHSVFGLYANEKIVVHKNKEYSRREADGTVSHVNTCESFLSLLKRGVQGAWHHVSPEHLSRYCDEFAFRWDHRYLTDGQRMEKALQTVAGCRLMYRAPANGNQEAIIQQEA